MSGPVMSAVAPFLIDTLVWTGALIALVLLVRRPVGRHFGPQIAYALWALPLLRFLMPPMLLPASMAPVGASTSAAGHALIVLPAADPGPVATVTSTPLAGIPWAELLVGLWLAGAVLFLVFRVRQYGMMRDELLAGARPVGEAGDVRLVETPAVSAPVAFGILDKVVALPPFFMVQGNLGARDMAIAHELAHHRGQDLLANAVAQPLLALHWFNPLAWWGWRAMRRDQEAACDARVVAGRDRAGRAAYAEVIAGFAAREHLALAAPMACPVLGEKSIVHRLRSLTMSEISPRRRRLGLAAIAATALAVPMTATVSYALPETSRGAPEPPAVPEPPLPPEAPEVPEAPELAHKVIKIELGDDEDDTQRVERRVIVLRDGIDDVDLDAEMDRLDAELAEIDRERIEKDVQIALADADRARAEARRSLRVEREVAPRVASEIDCGNADRGVVEHELGDGRRAIVICKKQVLDSALDGIAAARDAIASDENLAAEQRERILRELDRALEEMEARRQAALEHSGMIRVVHWQVVPVRAVQPAILHFAPVVVRQAAPLDPERVDQVVARTA